jgi:beta-mannosidase
MRHDRWGGAEGHPSRYYGENLYDRALPCVLAEEDPTRPYVPSSPSGGEAPNSGGGGDQHYWDVWHGRGDYVHYRDSAARFASEFGFASAPGHRAIARMLAGVPSPLAAEVRHPLARFHDKTAKGYDTFVGYVELHYPPAKNLEEWSYYSQLNQRDALRFGIEHFRCSEFCKGSLIWQLNDCWPAQSWAVIDSEGDYKAAAYELRRLYAPLLLSIERLDASVRVWAVLDNAERGHRGKVTLEASSLSNGEVFREWSAEIELKPGERRVVIEAQVSGLVPERTLLVASFQGARRASLLAEPKALDLRPALLKASADPFVLSLECDGPVVDLFVWDEAGGMRFDDNFVTLSEAGRVTLRARGTPGRLAARSLAGRHVIAS